MTNCVDLACIVPVWFIATRVVAKNSNLVVDPQLPLAATVAEDGCPECVGP